MSTSSEFEDVSLEDLSDTFITKMFMHLTKIQLLRMASLCQKTMNIYQTYHKSLRHEEQETLKDLAGQMFIKQKRWDNVLSFWLLRYHKCALDLTFLTTLPKALLIHMDALGVIFFSETSYPNPHKFSVTELTQKLPIGVLYNLWSSKFIVCDKHMDETFHLDPIKKYKYGEKEKIHLNKLTWYIFLNLKNTITINRELLIRIVYWNLDNLFIQLFQVRKCFGLTVNKLLPFVLLFPPDDMEAILSCISDELTVTHFQYIYKHLPLNQFTYMTNAFCPHRQYQLFLRTLHPCFDADFLRWIKMDRNKKYITKLTV
jgi:hypothetical protein